MTTFNVYVDNTNLVEIRGLKNAVTDAFINDASVSVTIKDAAGAEVAGQTWPAEMSYVADSDGIYRAVLEDDLELVAGQKFVALVDANGGSGSVDVGHWELVFVPQVRRLC